MLVFLTIQQFRVVSYCTIISFCWSIFKFDFNIEHAIETWNSASHSHSLWSNVSFWSSIQFNYMHQMFQSQFITTPLTHLQPCDTVWRQQWYWLLARWYQSITWTNVDLPSVRSSGINSSVVLSWILKIAVPSCVCVWHLHIWIHSHISQGTMC